MKKFFYVARVSPNKVHEGSIEAPSARQATKEVHARLLSAHRVDIFRSVTHRKSGDLPLGYSVLTVSYVRLQELLS